MIQEINLNEAEYVGNAEAGSSIRFSRLLDWFAKVDATKNASYLKCVIASTKGCQIFNIADILFSKDLLHKDIAYAHGIQLALKEAANADALTIAHAAELFNAIAEKCHEENVSLDDVQVFTAAPNGKLSRFSWFYDDQYDTAYIVRNMAPSQARKWLQAGAEVMAEVAKTPKKAKTSEEKELYSYWIELFGPADAKANWKNEFPGKRVPKV